MNPHPHAEVLRAIADGVPLSAFEVKSTIDPNACWYELAYASIIKTPSNWEIRRKPQHIMVNGFKVPKPLDVMPKGGLIFTPFLAGSEFYYFDDVSTSWATRSFDRNIAHGTKEAAIAHAKAMLGIDPEYFK